MPTVRSALIFLAVPGLLLGLAAPSPATTPRLNALGAAGDYVEDDTGYLRWYGALGDQDNAVTADFGHFNIYQGYHDEYANTLSGPALHWRHRLGETVGTLAAFWQAVDDDLPNGTLHRNYRADSYGLTYGRDLGPVQLGLAYQNSPNSDRVYPSHPAARYHRQRKSWGLGARADISSGAYWDLALTTEKVANDFEHDGDGVQALVPREGRWSTGARARLFLRLGPGAALVPLVEYLHEDRPTMAENMNTWGQLEGTIARLGCGLNYYPDTDHLFILSAEWDRVTTDYAPENPLSYDDWSMDWNSLDLLAAVENRSQPWLTLRGAVFFKMIRGQGVPPSWEVTDRDGYDLDHLGYTLGFGLHLPGWDLDTALASREPRPVGGNWEWNGIQEEDTWVSVALRRRY